MTHNKHTKVAVQPSAQFPRLGGVYWVDEQAGVFRRFAATGWEVEAVPMHTVEGQRLLVKLGEQQR
jgi:hypothetical protein